MGDPLRHHKHDQSAFGADRFGQNAERLARLFGTPRYIVAQSAVVLVWIAINAAGIALRWDPYPFILLNLAFSTQAAYAAPLILLAQTRQAERDKALAEADARHREEIADEHRRMLAQNTDLTAEIHELAKDTRALLDHRRRASS